MNSFNDPRGTLFMVIKNHNFLNCLECTVSKNKKNVFRGFHINNFDKLITCIQGRFMDFVINPETLVIEKYLLSEGSQILVPKNYAHGFLSLEEDSILIYHFNGIFNETKYLNVPLKIPELKIPDLIISENDLNYFSIE